MIRASAPHRLSGDDRGTAALEFALLLPILATILFGVVEIGRTFLVYNELNRAVAAAARLALIDADASSQAIEDRVRANLDDNMTLTITIRDQTSNGVLFTEITATNLHAWLIPLVAIPDLTVTARKRVPRPET